MKDPKYMCIGAVSENLNKAKDKLRIIKTVCKGRTPAEMDRVPSRNGVTLRQLLRDAKKDFAEWDNALEWILKKSED